MNDADGRLAGAREKQECLSALLSPTPAEL
jgi:hypothetical protein